MGIGVNARTAFSLFFPPMLSEFGWDRAITAGGFSFGFLISAMLSPVLGRLMDRFGPILVMELGVLFLAAGLLLAPFTTQPWHLYLTLGVLVGAGSVCLGYSGQSLFLPNWFERKTRSRLEPRVRRCGCRLHPHAPVGAGNNRCGRHGARLASRLGIASSSSSQPLNLLLRKPAARHRSRADGDRKVDLAPGAQPSNVVDAEWAAIDWTPRRALATMRFWWLALGYFSTLFVWYAIQVHQTKYLSEIGFDSTTAAWSLGFVSLAGIPGQIALGALSDRSAANGSSPRQYRLRSHERHSHLAAVLALVDVVAGDGVDAGRLGYGITRSSAGWSRRSSRASTTAPSSAP